MKKLALLIALSLFGILGVSAQTKYIGMKKAKQIALKRASGKIESSELEKEKGRMVYSFDIRNKRGTITEVLIDAKTGKIIEVSIENATAEAKEKAEDAKKKQ